LYRLNVDDTFAVALRLTAGLAAGIVLLIVLFVVRESAPALSEIGVTRMLTDDQWRPRAHENPRFGVLPMLAASALVTVVSLLIAVPLGLAGALFSQYYAPRVAGRMFEQLVELLAGVPSVVFGFWGLVVLVPMINRIQPPGHSLLAGGVVLSLMILPTVLLTATAAFRSIPVGDLRAAAALGMGRWAIVRGLALPMARPAIASGVLRAGARAVGETMAVVMVCGNVVRLPGSVFDSVRSVTANIALEMGDATQAHRAVLFATGLLLIVAVAFVLLISELVDRRRTHA
jgi:phosphate transport system permease protein